MGVSKVVISSLKVARVVRLPSNIVDFILKKTPIKIIPVCRRLFRYTANRNENISPMKPQ